MAITNNLKLLGQSNIGSAYSSSIDGTNFAFKTSTADNYTYLYTSDLNRLLQNVSLPSYALTKWIEANYTTGESHTYDVGETPTTIAGYIKDDFNSAIVKIINDTAGNRVTTLEGYFTSGVANNADNASKLNNHPDTYFAKQSDMTTANTNIGTLQSYFTGSKATNAVTADTAGSAYSVELSIGGSGTDHIEIDSGGPISEFIINNVAHATTADKTTNYLYLHQILVNTVSNGTGSYMRLELYNNSPTEITTVDDFPSARPCGGHRLINGGIGGTICAYIRVAAGIIIYYIDWADSSLKTELVPNSSTTAISDTIVKLAVSQ